MFLFFFPSCLGGLDNIKHQNEIDLFEAIDQNVRFTVIVTGACHWFHLQWCFCDKIMTDCFFNGHIGIQTQTYRSICVVLFTEGGVWEIVAEVNKTERKGETFVYIDVLQKTN